jgi:hypothetical protein
MASPVVEKHWPRDATIPIIEKDQSAVSHPHSARYLVWKVSNQTVAAIFKL